MVGENSIKSFCFINYLICVRQPNVRFVSSQNNIVPHIKRLSRKLEGKNRKFNVIIQNPRHITLKNTTHLDPPVTVETRHFFF